MKVVKRYLDYLVGIYKNKQWKKLQFIYANIDRVDLSIIEKYPRAPEIEHQVGRFFNMQQIASEIEKECIPGDVVEFGTYQGLGLCLLSKSFKFQSFTKTFVGIDSFEGLPETSTIWRKGTFHDTSYYIASQNISNSIGADRNFSLIQGLFTDLNVKSELYDLIQDIVLVHFDADLGSSTKQALEIIEPYLHNLNHPIYFLFDDWGCHPDEVPDAFYDWIDRNSIKYKIKAERLSSTRFTRYYKITFQSKLFSY